MLMKKDCTVTVVHSRTKDPAGICRRADVIIAAAGSAHMVKKNWIKKGAGSSTSAPIPCRRDQEERFRLTETWTTTRRSRGRI